MALIADTGWIWKEEYRMWVRVQWERDSPNPVRREWWRKIFAEDAAREEERLAQEADLAVENTP